MVAYYVSFKGIPKRGEKLKLPFHHKAISFPDRGSIDQVEMEISNAFFLRLKGLLESRIKALELTADWRTPEAFIQSIGLKPEDLDDSDKRMFSELCGLRNCLAHNYGLVDEKAAKTIPGTVVGRYVEMDAVVLKNWFIFTRRIFERIEQSRTSVAKLH